MRLLFATAALVAAPVLAQDMGAMPGMDHHQPPPPGATGHEGHDMGTMQDMGAMGDMSHAMQGALGPYPINREASGTAWQPDTTPHQGLHEMRGDWMLMGHALINAVYDHQSGPRGDSKAFLSGMVMGMAQRSFANGDALQFRAMFSPDPLMGKSGYPILLATGETANGRDQLTDRQHPHDVFMELSTSYSFRLGKDSSLFVYGGLPGEPAFGPPAFMHRLSILDSPEAPISHHWLDSTHITWGVLTAGITKGQWKLEASRYHGREPDQYRYGFEAGKLDSTAIRLSWNPTASLSLQTSWARQISPEQLEPDRNQTKWSASAILTRPIGEKGWWSATAAWGRRSSEHEQLDAFVLEGAVHPDDRWTIFARAEQTENDELVTAGAGHHGPTYRVGKASAGAIRDFALANHVKFGLGALYAVNFVPGALDPLYGRARGAMGFVRIKID